MLNPALYEALVKKFGTVKVSSENSVYVGRRATKYVNNKEVKYVEDVNRGEQYCVTCPICKGKNKLTISYICGTQPVPYTEIVWHKMHCFKCNYGKSPGTKAALKDLLSGYANRAHTIRIPINLAEAVTKVELESPGKLGPLLPDSSAGIYVEGRGFNVKELVSMYNMKRIVDPVDNRGFLKEYLWIPMYAEGKLVTWQARAIYSKQQPRWYLAKGGSKPIFNLDTAAKTKCIIIQEGIFDAIACGISGVAIMGKFLTGYMAKQLAQIKKPIIVCLDPDAPNDAKKLYTHLKQTHGNLVSLFQYPTPWPEEFNIDKNKMIPKDPAAVGMDIMLPLLNTHCRKHHEGLTIC